MKFLLCNGERVIARAVIHMHCSFFDIRDVQIIDSRNLPETIIQAMAAGRQTQEALGQWIACRQIPNSRHNIDYVMTTFLNVPANRFGRMYGYQLIPAFLSGFASAEDDFVLIPETKSIFLCAMSDERVPNLYFLDPQQFMDDLRDLRAVPMRTEDKMYTNPYDRMLVGDETGTRPTGMFASFSYTIPERVPAIWVAEDGRWHIRKQSSAHV